MVRIKTTLTNELGNEIEMEIIVDQRGVTVHATGPSSRVEHTWTPLEAMVLRNLLGYIEPAYKDREPPK